MREIISGQIPHDWDDKDRDGSREGYIGATSTHEILCVIPQPIFLLDTVGTRDIETMIFYPVIEFLNFL